jgi:hypothetical protein
MTEFINLKLKSIPMMKTEIHALKSFIACLACCVLMLTGLAAEGALSLQ